MSTQTNLYFGTNGIWKYTVSRIMYLYGRNGTMTQTFLRVVFVRFRKSEPKDRLQQRQDLTGSQFIFLSIQ